MEELQPMEDDFDFIEDEQEVDPVSKTLLTRFEDAPIPNGRVKEWKESHRSLKFKLNPNGIDGIGFITNDEYGTGSKVFEQETLLYPINVPTLNSSQIYVEYISNLFKIYESLGDERYYSTNTIGVINKHSKLQQQKVLNEAFELIINELGLFIEMKNKHGEPINEIFELEEVLNILNLFKALYFSEEYEFTKLFSKWINIADPQPTNEDSTEIMNSSATPYKHALFWKFLNQLILRGLFKEASNVLKDCGFEQLPEANIFIDLSNLLANYPESSSLEIFKSWKQTCLQLLEIANQFDQSSQVLNNLKISISIVSGNKSVIIEHSQTWYEAMNGLICYAIPSPKLVDEYFGLVMKKKSFDSTCIWESSCIDLFNGNFLQVLRSISSFSNATAAYTSALLEAKGLLNGYSFDDDGEGRADDYSLLNQDLFSKKNNISEFLLNSHALDCLSIHELVPVGIGILSLSKNPTSRSVISEFLPYYKFKTNDDIEWALTICANLKLFETSKTIYKIAGQNSLSMGYLFEALNFFCKSGDLSIVKQQCWLIFENALIKSAPIDDQIINSIVDDTITIEGVNKQDFPVNSIIRQFLSPYAILYQFFKFKSENNLNSSILKLVSILKFKYLPKKYIGILLLQFLPILINSINLIKFDDLMLIIKILNNFEIDESCEVYYNFIVKTSTSSTSTHDDSHWFSELSAKGISLPTNLENLVKFIRRSLAIEISRSFLNEKV